MILWLVAVAALCVAIAALREARRSAARLEQVSQLYWDVKYQQGELREELRRAAGSGSGTSTQDGRTPPRAVPEAMPADRSNGSFVPLVSLKR